LHWGVAWTRAALALVALAVVAAVAVSGGSSTDPRTPPGLPGLPPPFLGVAVIGDGGLTAAIDSYGDVVDLRAPGPAGRGLIENPAERQAAGTVPSDTGIVPRVSVEGGNDSPGLDADLEGRPGLPLWRADRVSQQYLPGTNVLRTEAKFGEARVDITYAARGGSLACISRVSGTVRAQVSFGFNLLGGRERVHCNDVEARRIIGKAVGAGRRWIARARPLGAAAPSWARRMYVRSLLILQALSDRRAGAVAAGARDGWAYVWPRDAGAATLALAAAGYKREARRTARFLTELDRDVAARFDGHGNPVPGREPQGDAQAWTAVAARAAGVPDDPSPPEGWRNQADYQEKSPGDYLANAIASSFLPADGPISPDIDGFSAHRRAIGEIRNAFETSEGLARVAGEAESGMDSAAAWAVRPFPLPALFPAVRASLRRLLAEGGRFGIVPSEDWPEDDPWTAPTAWSAWSFAALAAKGGATPARDRAAALHLLGDLRRAATPTGMLPERVDARSGIPRSTTPLAWSHAFAILALRQLWP
jgi:hypothetical protein